MENKKSHVLRNILLVVLALILVFIISMSLAFDFVGKVKDDSMRYEYVMKDVFAEKDPRVVDIAMLGAHDAFSSDISFSSEVNKNETGIVTNKLVGFLAKGFVKRMSKAQNANAMQLLKSGVRYLDVRITLVDGEYYTAHGLISNTLGYYLKDVVEFLGTHPGEVIVFDIQHFQTPTGSSNPEEFSNLFAYMKTVKNSQGKSIFDYVYYSSGTYQIPLSELRYSTATNGKTTAGAIVLAKIIGFSSVYARDGQTLEGYADNSKTIRSLWHETNSYDELVKGIEKEVLFVKDSDINGVFVVNQAQLTGFVGGFRLVKSVFKWSIMDMAADSNAKLVQDKDAFMRNIQYLKIFMVDNATSTKGNFNQLVNEYILEANKNNPGYWLDGTYKSSGSPLSSVFESYVQYIFSEDRLTIETCALGPFEITKKCTYTIDGGKISITYYDVDENGFDYTYSVAESFVLGSEDPDVDYDAIVIGGDVLKKVAG